MIAALLGLIVLALIGAKLASRIGDRLDLRHLPVPIYVMFCCGIDRYESDRSGFGHGIFLGCTGFCFSSPSFLYQYRNRGNCRTHNQQIGENVGA